ncbi:hypothetical protein SAMN05880574_12155 [Chryseobacterium sp. RU37D]|nr:hypothetical protein SAMN05880574_12155 [Chryseobacterium sp. RU37D]
MLVCKDCFSDNELKRFIISSGHNNGCGFCKKKDIETINLEELFDFFKELFDKFQIKTDGERLISKIQGNWNLFSDIAIGNRIMNYVIGNIDTHIQNSEELVDFNIDILDNVNYWHTLKEQLKWERRYLQDEFYAIAFRKKIYRSIEELQLDLNSWLSYYNNERTHTGKHCYGKTPMQTFLDSKTIAKEKLLETLAEEQKILTFGSKENVG